MEVGRDLSHRITRKGVCDSRETDAVAGTQKKNEFRLGEGAGLFSGAKNEKNRKSGGEKEAIIKGEEIL